MSIKPFRLLFLIVVCLFLFTGSVFGATAIKLISKKTSNFFIDGSEKTAYNILVLGSDSRTDSLKGRSDSMIVVRIDPNKGSIDMVSFPRDSKVNIPGRGATKINAAYSYGDVELAVKTVEQYAKIKIDNYMVTNFGGFNSIINKIGGLNISLDRPIEDRFAGPFLAAGKQRMNGLEALALARSRKVFPRGDFDRAANQQKILKALFMQEKDAKTREFIVKIASVMPDTKTDMTFLRAIKIAMAIRKIDPSRVNGVVLEGSTGGGGGMVVLNDSFAEKAFSSFR